MSSTPKIFALRLHPGDDLKKSLAAFAVENDIQAGYIITCAGSLCNCSLRFAGQPDAFNATAKFEILALSGTLSAAGMHLHIALADETGKTLGGHLLDGNLIYTTAEVVIGEIPHLLFNRSVDPVTGYKELLVQKRTL